MNLTQLPPAVRSNPPIVAVWSVNDTDNEPLTVEVMRADQFADRVKTSPRYDALPLPTRFYGITGDGTLVELTHTVVAGPFDDDDCVTDIHIWSISATSEPYAEGHATREFTHPDVFTIGVAEGWADPETDPTRIDWATRQAHAAIPFQVVDNRPINPAGPTGIRYGRNEMGHWGEALAADAVVTFRDTADHQWLLMIEREDGYGWALPGGHADPGETPTQTAIRELAEETGLYLPDATWTALPARVVPDPRASDEAWIVTTPVHTHLGTHTQFPHVAGSDDATTATWVLADAYDALTTHLHQMHDGVVFAAHRQLLADILAG
jgi:ADP-ribose pyrophosphatase